MQKPWDLLREDIFRSEAFSEAIRSAIRLVNGRHAQFGISNMSGAWESAYYFTEDQMFPFLGVPQEASQYHHPLLKQARLYHERPWVDPRRPHMQMIIGKAKLFTDQEIEPSRDFDQHPLVREVFEPSGTRRQIGGSFSVGLSKNLQLAIMRPRSDGMFGESEKRALSPHMKMLQRSVALSLNLGALSELWQQNVEALNNLSSAMFLIDAKGYVKSANGVALSFTGEQGPLAIRRGRLEPQDSRKLTLYLALLERVTTGNSLSTQSTLLESILGKFSVLICPLATLDGSLQIDSACAVVFLNSLTVGTQSNGVLWAQLFGLTKAETRLATLLVDGCDLLLACEKLHLGRETLKSQLKCLFLKTGTNRQAALVSVLLSAVSVKIR